MKGKRLLWIGDAGCDSGFERATRYTVKGLQKRGYEVAILGVNFLGDTKKAREYNCEVYTAAPGGDMFGVGRLEVVVPDFRPDVIVIQNDPWNISFYMEVLSQSKIPVIGALAVDGLNCRGGDAKGKTEKERVLNDLALCIFWTEFGAEQARIGGYEGPSAVVPLGVDLDVYQPKDKVESRRFIGLDKMLPKSAYLIGNVNRNQPRKRLDLTLQYFAEWLRISQVDDAYLFLHVAPTGEAAYDLKQLSSYFGLTGRVILSDPGLFKGLTESSMPFLYSCFDLGMSTTQGEGFGLPALEMMACGVPQIFPDWAAYGEWAAHAASLVPCSSIACTFNGINVIGGVADRDTYARELSSIYVNPQRRGDMARRGLETAHNPRYRWESIGDRFGEAIERVLWAGHGVVLGEATGPTLSVEQLVSQ